MNSITNLSAKQLRKAANLKEKIAALENELSKILGSAKAAPQAKPEKSNKRPKLSKAARAKIAAAARKRWREAKKAGKNKL